MTETEEEQKLKKHIREKHTNNTYFSCGCPSQIWEGITLYLCNDCLDLLIGKKNGHLKGKIIWMKDEPIIMRPKRIYLEDEDE